MILSTESNWTTVDPPIARVTLLTEADSSEWITFFDMALAFRACMRYGVKKEVLGQPQTFLGIEVTDLVCSRLTDVVEHTHLRRPAPGSAKIEWWSPMQVGSDHWWHATIPDLRSHVTERTGPAWMAHEAEGPIGERCAWWARVTRDEVPIEMGSPFSAHEAPVPTEQVPRDRKFWNTWHAVNAEIDQGARRSNCLRRGHELQARSGEELHCANCNADIEVILADEERRGARIEREYDGQGKVIGYRMTHPR